MKIIFLIGLLTLVASCSSVSKIGIEHAGEEKVLSRIDDLSSRPDWLKESEPFYIKDGKVYSLGTTTIPADNNVNAAFRIAENNAKASISHSIEQRLDFVFQNAEEGTTFGANQSKYIGAEASKLTTNSLRLSKRYWEKVSIIQENGKQNLQIRVFATVEMPENDFKSAIIDSIRKNQGKEGISAEFAKKVDTHWNQFVSAESK